MTVICELTKNYIDNKLNAEFHFFVRKNLRFHSSELCSVSKSLYENLLEIIIFRTNFVALKIYNLLIAFKPSYIK